MFSEFESGTVNVSSVNLLNEGRSRPGRDEMGTTISVGVFRTRAVVDAMHQHTQFECYSETKWQPVQFHHDWQYRISFCQVSDEPCRRMLNAYKWCQRHIG